MVNIAALLPSALYSHIFCISSTYKGLMVARDQSRLSKITSVFRSEFPSKLKSMHTVALGHVM